MAQTDFLRHPALPGVNIFFVDVTPEVAKGFLACNAEGQRNLNPVTSGRYAQDMLNGDWLFSGAAVLFSDKGELIDGQHRLNAIVESGKTQLTLIIEGLDETVLHAIDQGRKKTYATLLAMKLGRPHPDNQAATIRAYWYWTIGNYGIRGVPRQPVPSELANALPTNSQLEALRVDTEERLAITFTRAAQVAKQANNRMPRINPTVWALVWVILTDYDIDLREGFFHELLESPKSPAAEYPINALKNKLSRVRDAAELDRVLQIHFVLKAFEAWRTGRLITTMAKPSYISWNTLAQPPLKGDN